jgi:replicative DNA helicase
MILFNGALEALSNGCTVLFVSMELSETELWTKMLSSYSMIPQRDLQDVFDKKRKLTDLPLEQQTDYMEASAELGRAKLHTMFVQHVRDGVDSIVAAAMALRLKYGEDEPIIVFVDYIQLLVKSGATKREDIEDASRKLKLSALEFSLCVVAAAQVNRASASNEDGMPRAYMLRDSGSLEQDADIVMMLNRPILQDETASPELMNIFVELNRTGPSQQWIDAKFLPEYQQLTDLNYEDDDEERGEDYDEPRTSTRTPRVEAEGTFDFTEEEDDDPRSGNRPRRTASDDDDDDSRDARRSARRSQRVDDDEYV